MLLRESEYRTSLGPATLQPLHSLLATDGIRLRSELCSREVVHLILNQIPKEFIVDVIPAARVPALIVNESGLLTPAR